MPPTSPMSLIDPSGRVRALVMELARPPSWELAARVWHGVQAELDLPAPAIAVSGTDGLQLWFSLAEPIAVAHAHAFLESLRLRFLPEVDARRVRLMPASNASAPHHAAPVPALHEPTGNWSAFVAPDLAPVFADTPWLDIAPNEEGQATLLRGLSVTKPAAFEAALERLGPWSHPPDAPAAVVVLAVATDAAVEDPKRFLTRVMNDTSVPLALRIDAAEALLRHTKDQPPR